MSDPTRDRLRRQIEAEWTRMAPDKDPVLNDDEVLQVYLSVAMLRGLRAALRAETDSRPAELDVERLMAAEQVNCGCYGTGGGWDVLHARHVAAEYTRLASTEADQQDRS